MGSEVGVGGQTGLGCYAGLARVGQAVRLKVVVRWWSCWQDR